MKCEACGYKFLFASSTKCPSCGDPREVIVAGEYDFLTANSPANALTNIECQPKRPFEQVAGIVAGPSSKDECKAEDSAYAQYRLQNDQNFMDGVVRAAAQRQAANSGLGNISITESIVGLKAANAHLTRRVAELEGAPMVIKSLEGRIEELQSYSHAMAMNLDELNAKDQETEAYQYLKRLFLHMAPQCCVLPDLLGVCTQVDNAIAGLKIDNAHLTRQLAAQALTHAEQMEGMGGTRPFNETVAARMAVDPEFCAALEEDEPEAEAQTIVSFGRTILKQRDRIAQLEETEKALRKVIDMKESRIGGLKSQLAMRVTPATQPTDAQQTASDVKAAPERRPDGTLKPAAKAWEAPKAGSDARRIGS